jgi:hypothetical protein
MSANNAAASRKISIRFRSRRSIFPWFALSPSHRDAEAHSRRVAFRAQMRGLLALRPVGLKEADCNNRAAGFPSDVVRDNLAQIDRCVAWPSRCKLRTKLLGAGLLRHFTRPVGLDGRKAAEAARCVPFDALLLRCIFLRMETGNGFGATQLRRFPVTFCG